jgi:hypothetical protein
MMQTPSITIENVMQNEGAAGNATVQVTLWRKFADTVIDTVSTTTAQLEH